MSSPADELAHWLEDQGIGLFGGNADWSVHVDREPVAPDRVVTLYDTGGPANFSIEPEIRNPTIQVRVRGVTFAEAYEMQERISRLLTQPGDGYASFERAIGEHRYLVIARTSDIMSLGRDANDRIRLTANYEALRQPLEIES